MNKNYGVKIISALRWSVLSKILIQFYNFVTSIIAARILDPEDYGIMAIGLIIINYSNTITNFGFNNALVQKDKIDSSQINSVFSIDFSISIILAIIIFVFSSQIAVFFNIPECDLMFKVLPIIYILTTFEGIPRVLLRRSIDFPAISKIDIGGNVCNGIIVISLALMGKGYWSLLIGKISSMSLVTFLLLIRAKWRPTLSYDHKKMKPIFHFGMWNFFRAQIYYINKYVIQVITGKALGVTQLGYFEKAFGLSQMPLESVGITINSVMFSTFSRYQSNEEELNRWFINMIIIQTILIMPLLLGLHAIASHFIIVVLGSKWSVSILPMKMLCLASALSVYNGGLASFNIAIGRYREHTLRTFTGSCLLIIITLLVVRFGLFYICLSYLFVTAVWTILSINLAWRHLSLSFKQIFAAISPYLFANFVMFTSVLLLSSYQFNERNLQNLIALVCAGFLIYSIIVILINITLKNRSAFYPIKTT
jgi:teichuronic acid exporter